MTHSLILAATTALIRNMVENGLTDRSVTTSLGGDATVSALPPDRIAVGSDERAQVNLFLYQVTPKGLSAQSRHGDRASTEEALPPSILELYYLITAYGAQDLQIEVLLGSAIEVLNENVHVSQETIEGTLKSISSEKGGRIVNPTIASLGSKELIGKLTQLKISPLAMTMDELSRLWSTLQARYRPSAAYKVTVTISNEPK
jgi:hypothetical protein